MFQKFRLSREQSLKDMAQADFYVGQAHFLLADLAQRCHNANEVVRMTKAAMADYWYSLKLDPANVQANSQLGLCLEGLNSMDAALYYFSEAYRLSPGNRNPQACNRIGELLAIKAGQNGSVAQMERAISWFQLALKEYPQYAEAQANLMKAQRMMATSRPLTGSATAPSSASAPMQLPP